MERFNPFIKTNTVKARLLKCRKWNTTTKPTKGKISETEEKTEVQRILLNYLEGYKLSGPNFKASIALPDNHPSGIKLFNNDPRSGKKRPDAYAGIVMDTGSRCGLVKIGDNVVFERWDWKQVDLPDAMIVARERELLIINEQPVNNCVVFQIEDLDFKTTKLIIPHTYEKPPKASLFGKVLASSYSGVSIGERYVFEKLDENQYFYGDGRMAFRIQGDWNLLATYELEEAA